MFNTIAEPGFWMYETTGVLRPAIIALLDGADLTPEHIAALRAYLRQWVAGFRGVDDLRARVDSLTTKAAIDSWINDAIETGIDPL